MYKKNTECEALPNIAENLRNNPYLCNRKLYGNDSKTFL